MWYWEGSTRQRASNEDMTTHSGWVAWWTNRGAGLSWYEVRKWGTWPRCIHRSVVGRNESSPGNASTLQWNKSKSPRLGRERNREDCLKSEEMEGNGSPGELWGKQTINEMRMMVVRMMVVTRMKTHMRLTITRWCELQTKITLENSLWLANQLVADIIKPTRVWVMDVHVCMLSCFSSVWVFVTLWM